MESSPGNKNATFGALQTRLIQLVNTRIQNGDFTERGLARILGISQPQIHNVLKGARKLQPELADRLLRKLGIDVTDLLQIVELTAQVTLRHAVCAQCPNSPAQVVGAHLNPLQGEPITELPRKGAGRELVVVHPLQKQAC